MDLEKDTNPLVGNGEQGIKWNLKTVFLCCAVFAGAVKGGLWLSDLWKENSPPSKPVSTVPPQTGTVVPKKGEGSKHDFNLTYEIGGTLKKGDGSSPALEGPVGEDGASGKTPSQKEHNGAFPGDGVVVPREPIEQVLARSNINLAPVDEEGEPVHGLTISDPQALSEAVFRSKEGVCININTGNLSSPPCVP